MGILEYDSNNSGGSWWLSDEDWEALEKAGWNVHWGNRVYGKEKLLEPVPKTGDTWLGAIAMSAAKEFNSAEEGIAEFESITGQDAAAEGCNCCGPPHNFTWYENGEVKHASAVVTETKLEWW